MQRNHLEHTSRAQVTTQYKCIHHMILCIIYRMRKHFCLPNQLEYEWTCIQNGNAMVHIHHFFVC